MNLVYLLRTKTKTTRGCFELYCYVFLFFLPKKKYGFQWKFCFCRIKLKLCLSNWPVLILFWFGVFFTLGKNHGFCRFENKKKGGTFFFEQRLYLFFKDKEKKSSWKQTCFRSHIHELQNRSWKQFAYFVPFGPHSRVEVKRMLQQASSDGAIGGPLCL